MGWPCDSFDCLLYKCEETKKNLLSIFCCLPSLPPVQFSNEQLTTDVGGASGHRGVGACAGTSGNIFFQLVGKIPAPGVEVQLCQATVQRPPEGINIITGIFQTPSGYYFPLSGYYFPLTAN